MAFTRPTLAELIARAKADLSARLPGADALLRRSVLGTLAEISAGAVHGLYGFLDYQARQLFVDTADGDHLTRHAEFWGTDRTPAQFADGSIDATGGNGLVIPAGSSLLRGDAVEYITTAPGTIVGGTVTLAADAVEAGADGNADAGVVLTFASPIAGVDAQATVAAGGMTGGADAETDEALRARTLRRKRTPPRGGHANDYEAWALEVAGVTRAWAYEQLYGVGTVGVTFVRDGDPDGFIPLAADVTEVDTYLRGHVDPATGRTEGKPATVELTTIAPTAVAVAYSIAITPDTAEIRAAIEAELDDLHLRDAEPGGTLYLSRINEAISAAAGEFDHVLSVPAADVTRATLEISTRGTITWL